MGAPAFFGVKAVKRNGESRSREGGRLEIRMSKEEVREFSAKGDFGSARVSGPIR